MEDLYDFDDPMSDSGYDDLDEYTGIYHDEDPRLHSSHHIKRHYTEEEYYHARDRYFPEDSYHAAGQMKYDVVPEEDLVAHAIGKDKESKGEKDEKQEKKDEKKEKQDKPKRKKRSKRKSTAPAPETIVQPEPTSKPKELKHGASKPTAKSPPPKKAPIIPPPAPEKKPQA